MTARASDPTRGPGSCTYADQREPAVFVAFPGWLETPEAGCAGCRLTVGERYSSFVRLRWLQRMGWLQAGARRADVVVFHLPTTSVPIRLQRRPGQIWVAWSLESESHYPALADPDFMSQFDLVVSYRRDADVFVSYVEPEYWLRWRAPEPRTAWEQAPAVYIASSRFDHSGRTDYVRELMRHMAVDSYGSSLNNRAFAHDQGRPTKFETIARYRFTLAFENSIGEDYVTEKFYEPLLVGSVPVYLGAPNVAEHAPAPGCYIDVRDFAGPSELARYLTELSHDETRFASYLEWHQHPLSPAFTALVEAERTHPMCRLCRLLRERAGPGRLSD